MHLLLQDGQAGRALSDRARGRRPQVPAARARGRACGPSRRRLLPAARELEDTEKMIGAAEALVRALSVGPLRHAGAAAVLPVRRDGKSDDDLPDADLHRRRQEPGQPDRARTGAQLVGQPCDQRDLVGLLAQRGDDHLRDLPDRRIALRAEGRGAAICARLGFAAQGDRGPWRHGRCRHPALCRAEGPQPGRRADRNRL